MSSTRFVAPGAIALWWGMRPALQSRKGGGRSACALWLFPRDGEAIELVGDPDPEAHIISIAATGLLVQDYFAHGTMRFSRLCRSGILDIVPAGELSPSIAPGDAASRSFFHIYLSRLALSDLITEEESADHAGEIDPSSPQVAEDVKIDRISRTLLSDLRHDGSRARPSVDTLYQDLAIQMLRSHSVAARLAGRDRQPTRGGLAPWQLRRATDAMEAHLAEHVGLKMLADIAGCSPTHFSCAFKRSTGQPPFAWLLHRRVERAKELLADPRRPLAEVALAIGFSAQPQFTTAFRRVTGVTPGAWRRARLF